MQWGDAALFLQSGSTALLILWKIWGGSVLRRLGDVIGELRGSCVLQPDGMTVAIFSIIYVSFNETKEVLL